MLKATIKNANEIVRADMNKRGLNTNMFTEYLVGVLIAFVVTIIIFQLVKDTTIGAALFNWTDATPNSIVNTIMPFLALLIVILAVIGVVTFFVKKSR